MAKNYSNHYSRSVAIIGSADSGEPLEPLFVDDIEKALDFFKSGELVEAAEEILNSGASYLYLIRINPDSSYDKYYELKKAYSILESMNDIDVILPLDLKLMDKIISYPDIFNFKEQFSYSGDSLFETKKVMESINYVKVKGEKTEYYALRDAGLAGGFDAVIIDDEIFDLNNGDTVTIDYNSLKKLEIEFELLKFVDGRIKKSIELKKTIDANIKTNKLTDKPIKDYFFDDEENTSYIARSKNKAFNVYTKKDGSGYVYSDFDFEKYIAENTEYKYFVTELAKTAMITNSIGVVKKSSKDYLKMTEDILDIKSELNNGLDLGRNIAVIASDCRLSYLSSSYITGYEKAFAGLLGSTESKISLSNLKNEIVSEINDDFTNLEIKSLSEMGYTVLYKSIRNGIVPYRAVTISDEKSFYNLKNMRVIKEVQTRIKEITDLFIGKGNINLNERIYSLITELLEDLVREEKIKDFSFRISEATASFIKTEVELDLINELNTVRAGIISGA